MMLGIQLNTTPEDYAPYQTLRMATFEGSPGVDRRNRNVNVSVF